MLRERDTYTLCYDKTLRMAGALERNHFHKPMVTSGVLQQYPANFVKNVLHVLQV